MNKLINILDHKSGDVYANDSNTRKTTHWLVEQLARTIFGLRDGESDDSTFATPDQNDSKYARTIRTLKLEFTEGYDKELNTILTGNSTINYVETR